jgi:hypothetical protein
MKQELKDKVKSMVNKYGIEHTLEFFDTNIDIIKKVYQDDPSEFLNQFNNTIRVEKDGKIYYVDKNNTPLFYYSQDRIDGCVWINYERVWIFFSEIIRLNRDEIVVIMNNWLEEDYNIKDLTPVFVAGYNWNTSLI